MMVMPYRDGVSLRRGTLMAVLAHGRPLITTMPAEATPEFRHGENMWLVAPDDVAGVVNAVTSLAGDEGARARLGQGALDLARSFSWDAIAARTAGFYADVLAAYRR
jgi:glycosyltransferase involved in cell wall biosynthesis